MCRLRDCRPRCQSRGAMGSLMLVTGRSVASGSASGEALAADVPLSFGGGYDRETAIIIDRRPPLPGQLPTGGVFFFPSGRGSSPGGGLLLEPTHNATAPAAIITSRL